MAKSTKSRKSDKPQKPREKPDKPRPDFPLYPHGNRQWAKKVRGKRHFFGTWDDPDAALQKWLDEKDDLLAGRTPRTKANELTVKELADRFLTAKLHRVRSGELSRYSYRDYVEILQRMADVFGKGRAVVDLAADDFEKLRNAFAKTHGPARLRKDVTTVRSLFLYAYESGLIDRPVRFGPEFKPPSRVARMKARRANGRKDFTAEEARKIVDLLDGKEVALDRIDEETGDPVKLKQKRNPTLRAMFLLALNTALGNTDIGELREDAVQGDWLVYPRQKTQVDRRAWLWPETRQVLRDVLENRPEAADPADADCVFLTPQGAKYCRLNEKGTRCDAIGRAFGRVLRKLGIDGRRNFYSARHTFRTVAATAKDEPAADCVMGHSPDTMASVYTHAIDDSRLKYVSKVVRLWLWGEKIVSETERGAAKSAEDGQGDAGESE